MAKRLIKTLDATPSVKTPQTVEQMPRLTMPKVAELPFPIEVYPIEMQKILLELRDKQGLSLDYCGTALLSFLGAAIGAKVRLRVAGEWVAPLCIWTCIIGESGTRKSPVFRFFKKPFWEIEKKYQRDFVNDMAKYEADYKEWSKEKEGNAPKRPVRKDFVIEDTTTEAIKTVLGTNPHGVFSFRDELLGLLNSFNKYSKGGDDQQSWIQFFEGDGAKRNLMSRDTMFTDISNVCITGGTQPSKLPEFVSKGRDDDGFIYRFLFTFPSGLQKSETLFEEGVSDFSKIYYSNLIQMLHGIEFSQDENFEITPTVANWCPDAVPFFKKWYAENAKYYNQSEDSSEKGVISKLEGYLPRLALLLEIVERQCENECC
jgi:hypothetical protein